MSRDKQNIKTTDWLTRGVTEADLAKAKEEAIKEAEAELRDKQIEEMAKQLYGNFGLSMPTARNVATYLTEKKGYRKSSEVAREIFEEIDLIFRKQFEICPQNTGLKLLEPLCQAERFVINELWHEVAKLKKKYTEEGK